MNVRKMLAGAGFITLTLAGAVAAHPAVANAGPAVLISPVAWAGDNNYLGCSIVNAGPTTITVTMEILEYHGHPLETAVAMIPPGEVRMVDVISSPGYCKFTGHFNKSLVRASLYTYDPLTGGSHVVLPAQ